MMPTGLLEETLLLARQSLFSHSDWKQMPYKVYKLMQDELDKGESMQLAEMIQGLNKPLLDVAHDFCRGIEYI